MFLTRFLALLMIAFITACHPTVKIEAPDKPIVINLNIKLEEEIIIRLDKDIEKLLSENHDLF
ncbi:MAG: YnbE family lipoprotein [Alphaproteobacteria bacterium]|nr:YnbE family lipoprotein [Alphaproteobacteria bacterium]